MSRIAKVARAIVAVSLLTMSGGCGSTEAVPADAAVDGGGPWVVTAVPGTRCGLANRIGLFELSGSPGTFVVGGTLFDRPYPPYGAYVLSSETCGHHVAPVCGPCDGDELCGHGGCASMQNAITEARLTLAGGGQEESFTADSLTGGLGGPVTLSGTSFSAELSWPGYVVTLSATTPPDELTDLIGTLSGSDEAPTGLDFSWTAPNDGGQVYTHIPINHHAGGPTFTECFVDASVGELHVEQAMLEPLAIATGLEFQTLDQARFAAAETGAGCVEFRWFMKRDFVDLGY
jgi:hypothetical protein